MVLVQVTSRPRESDSSDYGLTDGRCAQCGLCGACKLMLSLCCYFVVCFVVVSRYPHCQTQKRTGRYTYWSNQYFNVSRNVYIGTKAKGVCDKSESRYVM